MVCTLQQWVELSKGGCYNARTDPVSVRDAGLPRERAETEAAKMTATLARNRGYPWRALRLALAERPDLAAQVPDTLDPADRLLWGVPRLAILPTRRVTPQGRIPP